ncbi:MAG TPA: hypothetical protein VHM91_02335 [Verrucomicrobiales bacterium]|jgi:YHS domain-containing protein|nr:hypothetical protein [Verrucomicrobiales bacterium]
MKQFIAALIAGLLLSGAAHAADPVNKKCPVSGKDIDAAKTSDVSVTVAFCCEKCQAKFEGDAKMKSDAVKKYVGSKESPANTKCVVSSKDIDKTKTATATTTVAFCCDKCKAEFDKDPKKYMAKVK